MARVEVESNKVENKKMCGLDKTQRNLRLQ